MTLVVYFRAETERGLSRKHIIEGVAQFYSIAAHLRLRSTLSYMWLLQKETSEFVPPQLWLPNSPSS